MGIVGRIIQPGVTVSLHSALPKTRGHVELGRSRETPGAAFSERGRTAVNLVQMPVFIERQGTARYVAIWIEEELEGVGKLLFPVPVEPEDQVYFPRGQFRMVM